MTFTKLLGSVALATALVGVSPIAVTAAVAQPANFKAEADAMLEAAYPADGPGAAVVVSRGGRILYSAGRGLADLETRRPITADTAFKLGSIAKQFTAALILQLVAEGRISLDDPISRFYPDFPQRAAGATVRQLLNHTSGLFDFTKIPGWVAKAAARPYSTAELVAEVRDRPAKSAPGAGWEYNNAGYMLLGTIVEKVTGKAWHEAVAERIARPLGLRTVAGGAAAGAAPAVARGYTEESGQQRRAFGANTSLAPAAGPLVGSAVDLAKWAQALHHGRVVSPALYQEMIRPARLADGSTRPYGFGLRLQALRGRRALVHGGAGAGLDTDSVYIPSEDLFVAVVANSDDPKTDPSTLTRRLAALALGEAFPTFRRADVAFSAVEPLFGAYAGQGGAPLRFFSRNEKLYLASGDEEMEAFPAGEDRFFFGPETLAWIRFERQPDGAHVMELHEPARAQPARAVRTGSAAPSFAAAPAVLQSYVGTYATETVKVTVALGANGQLTIQGGSAPVQPMRPVSETEFRVDAGGFRVVFHPENGKVDRLTLYRGARELHGQRVSE